MNNSSIKYIGVILDSYGSNHDIVVDNGAISEIAPVLEADNPYRLQRMYAIVDK